MDLHPAERRSLPLFGLVVGWRDLGVPARAPGAAVLFGRGQAEKPGDEKRQKCFHDLILIDGPYRET